MSFRKSSRNLFKTNSREQFLESLDKIEFNELQLESLLKFLKSELENSHVAFSDKRMLVFITNLFEQFKPRFDDAEMNLQNDFKSYQKHSLLLRFLKLIDSKSISFSKDIVDFVRKSLQDFFSITNEIDENNVSAATNTSTTTTITSTIPSISAVTEPTIVATTRIEEKIQIDSDITTFTNIAAQPIQNSSQQNTIVKKWKKRQNVNDSDIHKGLWEIVERVPENIGTVLPDSTTTTQPTSTNEKEIQIVKKRKVSTKSNIPVIENRSNVNNNNNNDYENNEIEFVSTMAEHDKIALIFDANSNYRKMKTDLLSECMPNPEWSDIENVCKTINFSNKLFLNKNGGEQYNGKQHCSTTLHFFYNIFIFLCKMKRMVSNDNGVTSM